jgi:2-oxoglutarate dehydrogenase complex dehydrogenase (E1) component-like enzyme
MDPFTMLAAIKGGISAGKQIHSMSKEIAGFFDSVDTAKKNHQKKKDSPFTTANEEALDTFMKRQAAIDAEAQLREMIIQTRGFSQWQELLKLRRDIANERREAERKARKEAEERQEMVMTIALAIMGLLVVGTAVSLAGAKFGWF